MATQMFTKNDFYLDQAMLMRIRRMKSRREAGEEGEDDEDDDEDDEEEKADDEEGIGEGAAAEPEPPRSVKSRRSIKRERMDVDV